MSDAETAAAIESLAYRIRERDAAMQAGEEFADAEPFAAEYLAAMRGRGWRPVEALRPALKPTADGGGTKRSEATRAEIEAARQRLADINAAKQAAREADVA